MPWADRLDESWIDGTTTGSAVQEWVTGLGRSLAPGSVAKCYGVLLMILRTAVRARLIATNPAEGVKVPGAHKPRTSVPVLSREDFFGKLLPAAPAEHRAIICAAAGAGLRWGECAGLSWSAVDLGRRYLRVDQVAVETPAEVTIRPYPKTRAGRRIVPMPVFLVDALRAHRELYGVDGEDAGLLVFGSRVSGPLRRSNFRRRVWRPALVRAGLLGKVVETGPYRYWVSWSDAAGVEWSAEFTTERDAVEHVASHAAGGLRFHDLRHSYATWLVTDGVPINAIQRVMGHQQASTTLNRYTHAPTDYDDRVRAALDSPADFPLTPEPGTAEDDQAGDDPEVG
jgi:integrase